MAEARIVGDVPWPEASTRWVDKRDDSRTLWVEEVEPGDRLGREIRGTLHGYGSTYEHDGRAYATDIRTFHAIWTPLGQPVATS